MSAHQFPTSGWRIDSSNSTGTAMLFRDIPSVVVRVFAENERGLAESAFAFLKSAGVDSSVFETVQHSDGHAYIYVFAEKEQFLAMRSQLLPSLVVSA